MNKTLLLFCIIFSLNPLLFANNTPIKVNDQQSKVEILNGSEFLFDAQGNLSIDEIIKSKKFRKLPKMNVNFGEKGDYLWLKFSIENSNLHTRKFMFVTKGVDSLFCYQINSNLAIQKKIATGTHTPLSKREYTSSYLTFTFEIPPYRTSTIYLKAKNINYPLSVYPYIVYDEKAGRNFIKLQDLIQSSYIGGMLFLILFGIALLIFFQERLYFFYLLCVFSSLIMMLIYNDFSFLIFERLPTLIINKNFFGAMTTLISLLYLLFSQEFLDFGIDKKDYIQNTIRVAIINTKLVISIFLIFGINFYQHRFWVYPFIFFNCTLTLYLLFRSLQKKYRPAWLYLIATLPVLLVGIIETLSEFHTVTIQEMHSWYYGCTFFEMYVLTLGIVYKFKIGQDEKKRVQAEVFANETIIKEKEGHRIAQDLHDKIGGLLGLLKLNITNFSKNSAINKSHLLELKSSIEMIDLTAEEVRNIAHSLASSTLTKLGLVPLLTEMYQN
jgi:signal transduction histidine kinase